MSNIRYVKTRNRNLSSKLVQETLKEIVSRRFGPAATVVGDQDWFEVIFEHLGYEDNILVLEEIKRVLKPDGVTIIKTPNLTYLRFSRFYKMIKRIIKLKNPFDVVIPHTRGENSQHIGLITKSKMVRLIKSVGIMNFKFHYGLNSKIERFNYSLAELVAEAPFLRNIFSEDIIVVIHKPIILSFFP